MSPRSQDENESHTASNRTSAIHPALLVALVSSVMLSTGIKIMQMLRAQEAKYGIKKISDATHEASQTESPVFGQPFQLTLPTQGVRTVAVCDVAFLNDGFDVRVNDHCFSLQDLSVANSRYELGTIQSMLAMANESGLTDVEYRQNTGLIFHAGNECSVAISPESSADLFATLASREHPGSHGSAQRHYTLDYTFLKMPPMLCFILSHKGTCTLVLKHVGTVSPSVDSRLAHALR